MARQKKVDLESVLITYQMNVQLLLASGLRLSSGLKRTPSIHPCTFSHDSCGRLSLDSNQIILAAHDPYS
jgi:hypothetical protein